MQILLPFYRKGIDSRFLVDRYNTDHNQLVALIFQPCERPIPTETKIKCGIISTFISKYAAGRGVLAVSQLVSLVGHKPN